MLFVLSVIVLCARLPCLEALDSQPVSSHAPGIEVCNDTSLHYAVSFWLLGRAAQARLSCRCVDDAAYEAELEVRTVGLFRLLAGKRTGVLRSRMSYDADQGRFIPEHFEERYGRGESWYGRKVVFDYAERCYTVTHTTVSGKDSSVKRSLPNRAVDDILTAFYNFRKGCYGAVVPQSSFSVPLLVQERLSNALLEVSAAQGRGAAPGDMEVTACLERYISQVKSKRITGRLSESLVPKRVVIENAYFFGDIVFKLDEDYEKR